MNRAQTRELPGNHPFVVQQKFSNEFTTLWNATAQDLCGRIHSLTAAHVSPMIKSHFMFYGDGRLKQWIQYVCYLRVLLSMPTNVLTVC